MVALICGMIFGILIGRCTYVYLNTGKFSFRGPKEKNFRIHWKDGSHSDIRGIDIVRACKSSQVYLDHRNTEIENWEEIE